MAKEVGRLFASFLPTISGNVSMITVTKTTVSSDFKYADIYVTVLPEDKEEIAMLFVSRHLNEFRSYMKKRLAMRRIPFVRVHIDEGEKKRQKVFLTLQEIKRGE